MALTKSVEEIVKQDTSGLLSAHASWQRVHLREVAHVLNGFPFDSAGFNAERGMPLARIRDVLAGRTSTYFDGPFDSAYVLADGDLLVGMDGDFNAARWKGGRALLNQRVCKIAVDSNLYEPRLLDALLPVYLAAINAETSSVTVKHLSSRTIEDIWLPLPPRHEQQRLADKLDELLGDLEAAIVDLTAARRKLALYRQSLLKSSVEGSLTDGTSACWPMVSMAALPGLAMANGRSVPTAESGAKVLRLTCIRQGRVDLSQFKHGAWSEAEAAPFAVREGDLLVVRGNGSLGLVGRAGLVPPCSEAIAYPDTLIRVRADPSVVRPAWLACVWESQSVRTHLEGRARTSAGIYKISQPDIESACIPLPSVDAQDEALAALDAALMPLASVEAEITAAERLAFAQRQNILRAAFSGQLVPQDPNDEPASVLLERIHAQRQAAAPAAKRKPGRPVKAAA